MSKIEEFQKKKAEFQELIAKEGKSALVDSFKAVFDAVPELETLEWTQYTPHFNDGDVCEFSVHEFNATFNVPVKDKVYKGYKIPGDYRSGSVYVVEERPAGAEFEEISYGGSDKDEDPILTRTREAVKSLNSVKNSCEEIFEAAFGDGYRVTASREGFSTEYYDHD